jgi:hypothetical protein
MQGETVKNLRVHLWYLAEVFLKWGLFKKNCIRNKNTHFKLKTLFFSKFVPFMRYAEKCCGAEQIMTDNMAHAQCLLENWGYIHTHTYTHSQYVILIAFPQQQWLPKCASILRHMYTACLVYSDFYLHLHKNKQLLFSTASNMLHCTAEKWQAVNSSDHCQ